MTYDPNVTWTASTADKSKHPVHIIRFDDLAGLQYASGPVKSPSRTTHQYLGDLGGLSQEVDPFTGRITIGRVTFTLTDKDAAITDLISTQKASPTLPTLLNRGVTILSGYAQDAEGTYAPIYRGFVTEAKLTPDKAGFQFSLADPKRALIEDIFRNAQAGASRVETTLNASAAAGTHRITVNDVSNINPDDYLFVGPNGSGQEEKIQVKKVEGGTNPDAVITKSPLVYSYASGNRARWATTRLRGNPINIFFSLMTGNFAHASFPLILADGMPSGLGVAEADIDTAQLISERDEWMVDLVMQFEITAKQRAKDWMEKQLFLLFGYPVVSPDGTLGFHIFRSRNPTESTLTLNATFIIDWAWERRYDHAINRIVVKHDYDPERRAYLGETVIEDTANQATAGILELVVEHQGLAPGDVDWLLHGMSARQNALMPIYIEMYAKRYLRRFMHGAPELVLRCHLSRRIAQLGEAAILIHSQIPNVRTGARGLLNPITVTPGPGYEVIKIEHRHDHVVLTVQDNGFSRPAFIAPAGQPDYGSANTTHKRRAYISPVSGADFSSDGTEPYKVI
jgi:hypothetical protein